MDELETLLYEERDGVAIVTLNRPDKYNAFNLKMQHELRSVWLSLRTNKAVNAVVLTGNGKAFCTGIDREEAVADYLEDPSRETKAAEASGYVSSPYMFNDPGVNINPKANDLWKPVICAVNGMACAGALYMLGESDIIIASENATFFDPHVTYGMVMGFECVHLLQKLPLGELLRMALLGAHERMSAQRAHQMGLVSEVVAPDQLLERAMWIAERVASAPTVAVQGTLRAAWMAHELTRRDALSQIATLVMAGTTYDNIEAGQSGFHGQRIEPTVR
jgi:enoyl-CoA hydratase/carnithine racemase